jgi:hypothetical protein
MAKIIKVLKVPSSTAIPSRGRNHPAIQKFVSLRRKKPKTFFDEFPGEIQESKTLNKNHDPWMNHDSSHHF